MRGDQGAGARWSRLGHDGVPLCSRRSFRHRKQIETTIRSGKSKECQMETVSQLKIGKAGVGHAPLTAKTETNGTTSAGSERLALERLRALVGAERMEAS